MRRSVMILCSLCLLVALYLIYNYECISNPKVAFRPATEHNTTVEPVVELPPAIPLPVLNITMETRYHEPNSSLSDSEGTDPIVVPGQPIDNTTTVITTPATKKADYWHPDFAPTDPRYHKPFIPGLAIEDYEFIYKFAEGAFVPNPERFKRANESDVFCKSPPGDYTDLLYFVVFRHTEDVSWISQYIPKQYRTIVYEHDESKEFHFVPNRGKETTLLLQYFLDFYDCLPQFTIFMHGHGPATPVWHSSDLMSEIRPILAKIESGNMTVNEGYWSLNYNPNVKQGHWPQKMQHPNYFAYTLMHQYWEQLFAAEFGPEIPPTINGYCCLQFVAHRARIRLRSRQFYENLQNWVATDEAKQYIYDTSQFARTNINLWTENFSSGVVENAIAYILGDPWNHPLQSGCDDDNTIRCT